MRKPRFLFSLIIILTLLSVLIVSPNSIAINYDSPTIPIINQKISIHRNFVKANFYQLLQRVGFNRTFEFQKGLDLEGGLSITYKADMKDIPADKRADALVSAKDVIERRVNIFGVKEPVVQTATVNNDYRIIVEIPGETDVQEALRLIGTTAELTFWEDKGGTPATPSAQIATPSANIPPTIEAQLSQVMSNPGKTNLTGKDLQDSTVTFDQTTGQPDVSIVFTPEGAKKFADITKRNLGKRVAIVLDEVPISAPSVNSVISDGNARITGGFTSEQAKQLSTQLKAGALPVPLSMLEQRTIGATLGIASLQKSLFAGILGFTIIVIFMSVLYGRLGMIASFSLILYALFTLAIFKFIPVTLTLAGIAGFILSIGMAVDANILIFERMREELRRGKTYQAALELGFSRAWTSIRDSNISSLITSFILFQFGTGIVRGFALTLAIGVLVSMFSAITVTRTFLRIMGGDAKN